MFDTGKLRTLTPGQSFEAGTLIPEGYDLAPGTYEVQLSRRVSSNPKDGVVKSNTIKVIVNP